jgi:hypothetical protein
VRAFVAKGKLKHENASRVRSMPLPERPKWSIKSLPGEVRLTARNFTGVILGLGRRLNEC